MATGLPEGLELEMLEPLRDKVPAEVFTTPYKNPVNGNPEAVRNNLRESDAAVEGSRLSKSATASWSIPQASPSASKFYVPDEGNERIALFYKPSLERLGVTVNIRRVDSVQYREPHA